MTSLLLALAIAVGAILTLNAAILSALAWLSTRPDPVDEHYLTAAALLAPDDPRLPHAADCDCAECTYERFAEIIRDFYEEPTR